MADGWISEGSVHAGGFDRDDVKDFTNDFLGVFRADDVDEEDWSESEPEPDSSCELSASSEPESNDLGTESVAGAALRPSSTKNS